jgi:predicted CopG family antitoxin
VVKVETKTIKLSKDTYDRLCAIAGKLQAELKRPVSLEEAMKYLVNRHEKGLKITDLAGSWDVTEEEVAEIKASLVEAWKKWKLPKL